MTLRALGYRMYFKLKNAFSDGSFLNKFKRFDYFDLGNSFVLYYGIVFFLFPLLYLAGLRFHSVAGKVEDGGIFQEWLIIPVLILGIASFVAGRWLFNKKPLGIKSERVNSSWLTKNFYALFSLVFLVSIFVKIINLIDGRYYIFQGVIQLSEIYKYYLGYFEIFGWLSLALAFIWYFNLLRQGKEYKMWRFFAWSILILEFLNGFVMNSNFLALKSVVIYVIIRHFLWKKSIFHFLTAFFISILILLPAGIYLQEQNRAVLTSLREETKNVTESISRIYLKRDETVVGQTPEKQLAVKKTFTTPLWLVEYVIASVGRIDQTLVFSRVVTETKDFVYFKHLKNFFISLGPPRFLWTAKPAITFNGNEFGRKYKIINDHDKATNVGPTMLGDFYMAFGVWGVALGLFFLGWLYGLVFHRLIKIPPNFLSGVLIYSLLWPDLIKGMENQVAPVLAGAVKLVVFLFFIHLLLTRGWNRKEN